MQDQDPEAANQQENSAGQALGGTVGASTTCDIPVAAAELSSNHACCSPVD